MQNALIVEDSHETSVWLSQLLHSAFPGVQVALCHTCAKTREFILHQRISLALVDINLPDGNGIELVASIRLESPNAFIIISTIFDDDEHIMAALRSGANGYLLKDLPEPLFIQKLRGILTGDPPLSPSIARKILRCYTQPVSSSGQAAQHAPNGNEHGAISLSLREREVLILVAKGYSRKEVADLLGLSGNTIARYIRDVYQKLNISSRAEAALEACRMGLVQTGAD